MNRISLKIKLIAAFIVLAFLAVPLFLPAALLGKGYQPTPEDPSIAEMQQMLNTPMSPEMQQLLLAKMGALGYQATLQYGDVSAQAIKPSDICSAMPTYDPASEPLRLTGILNDMQPYPLSPDWTFTNAWQEQINGIWVTVYAGALTTDPAQGMLAVLAENSTFGGVFLTERASGALQIIEANGARLTLQDAAGGLWYFDVSALQFTASPDEALPTLIPQPTFTPTPGICP